MTKSTGTSEASDADSEVLEEDWSHLMNGSPNRTIASTASDDDNNDNNDNDTHEFSYYDTVTLPLSDSVSSCPLASNEEPFPSPPLAMQLRCVRRLTPLDMLDLYNGERDATGNRLWMGAVCFLECMVRPLHLPFVSCTHQTQTQKQTQEQSIARARALQSLRTELFDKRRVLELGCGTGASLIAIGLVGSQNSCSSSSSSNSSRHCPAIRPTTLTLTDNDPKVLALCEMNCRLNFQRQTTIDDVNSDDCTTVDYAVKRLDWGEFCSSSSSSSSNGNEALDTDASASIRSASQDTVVATDVIYDVAAIPVLFAAAAKLLAPGGALVVAHVPRAAVEDDNNVNDNNDNDNDNDNDHSFSNPAIGSVQSRLEQKLLDAASEHGFVPGGAIAGVLGSSLEVLCREHKHDDNDNEPACILRPSTIAGLWTGGSHEAGDKHDFSNSNKHISVPVPTLVSSDYDYEELEACGASILVFVKRTE